MVDINLGHSWPLHSNHLPTCNGREKTIPVAPNTIILVANTNIMVFATNSSLRKCSLLLYRIRFTERNVLQTKKC